MALDLVQIDVKYTLKCNYQEGEREREMREGRIRTGREGGREGGRDGGMEGGKEGGREGGREGILPRRLTQPDYITYPNPKEPSTLLLFPCLQAACFYRPSCEVHALPQ